MANKTISLGDLKPDLKNANTHSEYGMRLLEKSMRENGGGRSILISDDNAIIAGNGTVEVAGDIGIEKVRVIETDGSEIIAVKRTDIKSNTPEFFKMALADNIVAEKNIVMDVEVVNAIAEEYDVKEWQSEVVNQAKQKGNYNRNNADAGPVYIVEITLDTPEEQQKLFDEMSRKRKLKARVITK